VTDEEGDRLPFGGHVERTSDGWEVRLPLRREVVSVSKETVVAERVRVRRAAVEDTERIQTTLRREQARIETQPSDRPVSEMAEPAEAGEPHVHGEGTLSGSGMEQDPLG
jgi:stress response protein YsnF